MSYYQILSISKEFAPEDLKKAYHAALLASHPDKTQKSKDSIDAIKQAYCVLSSPNLRKQYDTKISKDDKFHNIIDLDDMIYDNGIFSYPCRCSGKYEITEEELEDGRDVVGCIGCSLWIRVAYEVVEG
ncbi:Diphthamide biosynthesis protein 4 [Neolecta irregularis DAH-3]|uniref:Diphthamide biosynthesis protein 4 n=1 Tax=Neolecta irregularis (strain DAH-3) TaxID=1198029 RepID=A0A1U7LM94_NEOID|nr:Diphthamide biosynthesis protein 4 [Neolecta irregularis DAH-3]|eukprot:OLL23786.1 Diphthamide biosynthesis protein 4 [Neolecta irregularis DAH-3]